MLVLALAVALCHWLAVWWTGVRLEAAREAAGGPSLIFADYVPSIEGLNGTDYLEAAALVAEGQELVYVPREGRRELGLLQQNSTRVAEIGQRRTRPTPEDLELFRSTVEEHSLTLEILDTGLRMAVAARYHTDYDVIPVELLIPNLLTRLRLAALLRARGELALAAGDRDGAWRDARGIFRIAHWTAEEMPTLIGSLVARVAAHNGILMVQSILSDGPADPARFAEVLAEATRTDPADFFDLALGAERASVVSSLVHPAAGPSTLLGLNFGGSGARATWWRRLLVRWRPWLQANAAAYLEISTERMRLCMLPALERDEEFEARYDELVMPFWADLARQALFDCREIGLKRDTWEASLDQLRIAGELEKAASALGGYPEELSDLPLAGVDVQDPFDGKALRYRRTASGYELWSVSMNRVDDSGALPGPNPRGRADYSTGDLVWRVERDGRATVSSP